MHFRERLSKKDMLCLCLIAFVVLITVIVMLVRSKNVPKEDYVKRPDSGKRDVTVLVEVPGGTKELTLSVPERQRTYEEITAAFQETVTTLLEYFFCEREVAVTADGEKAPLLVESLSLPRTWKDTEARIVWESSEEGVLASDGRLFRENVKNKTDVTLKALIMIGEERREEWFRFVVMPYEEGSDEQRLQLAREELERIEELSRGEEGFVLPKQVGQQTISLSKRRGSALRVVLPLLLLLPLVVVFALRREREQTKRRREAVFMRAYPQLVTKLSMYIGAGLSMSNAWERLAQDVKRSPATGKQSGWRNQEAVRNELLRLAGDLKNGGSEERAYKEFARRIGLPCYQRCCALLISQIQRGTGGLREKLFQEVEMAWDMHRKQMEEKGEEAQTKLLLPMFGMLILVLMVIMIPAFAGMGA